MANRAYLFATDNEFSELDRNVTRYYDSRWVIPLMWFLFFVDESARLKTVESDNQKWQVPFLIENKKAAVDRFTQRLTIVEKYFSNELLRSFDEVDFKKFIEDISNWKGTWLVMDLDEIVEVEALAAQHKFRRALQFLNEGKVAEFSEEIKHYTGLLAEAYLDKDIRNHLIGFTYR